MTNIRIITRGPDRYCPDCGRWLVHVHEDGTFDLASQAGMDQHGEMKLGETLPEEIEIYIQDAVCLICHPETDEERLTPSKKRWSRLFGRSTD